MMSKKPVSHAGRSIVPRSQLSVADYARDILTTDSNTAAKKRAALARAITLVESTQTTHQEQAQALLQKLLPHSGRSLRIGVSGVPGVGKSTFIDVFGTSLTAAGRKVAVLAVDPSSTRSGGSILGDKTRMQHLSVDPNAYIRPSPTSGTLGGVTRATRETIVLCEAAGFDTIIVETVGVGQSEVSIANMVDFYCLLMLPGAGDELQGIKKGVLEIADMIAVNKADPENDLLAQSAAADYRHALHIMTPLSENWQPPVLTCSALHSVGIDAIWEQILRFQETMQNSGEWAQKREKQQLDWMWSLIDERLLQSLHGNPQVRQRIGALEQAVLKGTKTPVTACREVLALYADAL